MLLIDALASAPITGTKNADDLRSVREANGQNSAPDTPKAVIAPLRLAVGEILGDHATWISERQLCSSERNPVFGLIRKILGRIPIEGGLRDKRILALIRRNSHTNVWRRIAVR